jgi:hypothetical protein
MGYARISSKNKSINQFKARKRLPGDYAHCRGHKWPGRSSLPSQSPLCAFSTLQLQQRTTNRRELGLNELMNSYAVVGAAHAELLLVTCLSKENPLGNKNLLLQV